MEKQKLTRREFLRLSTAAGAGAIVAACRPAAPQVIEVEKEVPVEKVVKETVVVEKVVEKPVEQLTLNYWFGWGATYGEAVTEATQSDRFKERFPGVQVEVLPSSGHEKLLTAIAAGAPPDGACNVMHFELFARGACMPITEWMSTSNVFVEDDYYGDVLNQCELWGDFYGIPGPENFARLSLVYNPVLAEEFGLDPNNPPRTWDECFEWHEKCTKFDSAGNVEVIGFDPYGSIGGNIGHEPWIPSTSWGFDYYDEENMEFNLDNPKMAEALATMGRFYEHIGPDNMVAFRESYGTYASPNASMFAKTQVMEINGYWQAGRRFHRAPDTVLNFTWIPMPEERRDVKPMGVGGPLMIIPKGAKHAEEMFHVAEFLQSDLACDLVFNATGWLPARISYLENVDPSVYPGLDWFFKAVEETNEWAIQEKNPIVAFMRKTWWDAREKVYRGVMAAEEAAQEMQEKCTEAMDELREQL